MFFCWRVGLGMAWWGMRVDGGTTIPPSHPTIPNPGPTSHIGTKMGAGAEVGIGCWGVKGVPLVANQKNQSFKASMLQNVEISNVHLLEASKFQSVGVSKFLIFQSYKVSKLKSFKQSFRVSDKRYWSHSTKHISGRDGSQIQDFQKCIRRILGSSWLLSFQNVQNKPF